MPPNFIPDEFPLLPLVQINQLNKIKKNLSCTTVKPYINTLPAKQSKPSDNLFTSSAVLWYHVTIRRHAPASTVWFLHL